MEGFKQSTKMQCFKEGGQVKYKSRRKSSEVSSADIAQDKAIVKKAFKMHDEQEHGGEHTDLSKLKKGGRTKKAVGTVRKYKTGGSVENIYGAKKKSGDLDNIQKVKEVKAAKLCMGKSVKKYADGRSVLSDIKDAVLGTPAQNAAARQAEAKYLRAKQLQRAAGQPMGIGEQMAMGLAGAGQALQPAANIGAGNVQGAPGAATATTPGQKRGGKVKKGAK
jgi:hypothetical protein